MQNKKDLLLPPKQNHPSTHTVKKKRAEKGGITQAHILKYGDIAGPDYMLHTQVSEMG